MHELENSSAVKFLSDLSCVSYECTASLAVTFLSENVFDVIGAPRESFLGNRSLWDQSVPPEDHSLLLDQMNGLKQERAGTLIHRLVDVDGLPVWVCNRMQRVRLNGRETVHGCLVPLGRDRTVYGLDPAIGAHFAHKLANQFQILEMILSSVRRSLPNSNDLELLQQTLDRAVEFARAFSQYNQFPTPSEEEVRVTERIELALAAQKAAFREKGIAVREEIDPALQEVTLRGDAFFLDLAFQHVLRNALEATEKNGVVTIVGKAISGGRRRMVKLSVSDTGPGIKESDLTKAATLYFSTKKNHDGVGLSLARRFVELHDGCLHLKSVAGKGTEVEILLPTQAVQSGGKGNSRRAK